MAKWPLCRRTKTIPPNPPRHGARLDANSHEGSRSLRPRPRTLVRCLLKGENPGTSALRPSRAPGFNAALYARHPHPSAWRLARVRAREDDTHELPEVKWACEVNFNPYSSP